LDDAKDHGPGSGNEAESQEGIHPKALFPLHIKIPLEAVRHGLIAVVAVYVFKAVEPEMKVLQPRHPRSRSSPARKPLIRAKHRPRKNRLPEKRLFPG